MTKTAPLEKKRVLLVDDELYFRLSAAYLLASYGYEVTEAADGAEAFTMIQDSESSGRRFDLIIADLILPKITGLTLLRNMRKQQINIPVLVISGYVTAEVFSELQQLSYRDILIKPFKSEEFKQLVITLAPLDGRKQ